MSEEVYHIPVMLKECIEALDIKPNGTYVDVTFKEFKFESNIARDILKVGIPSSLDMLMMSIAMSFYLIFISSVAFLSITTILYTLLLTS